MNCSTSFPWPSGQGRIEALIELRALLEKRRRGIKALASVSDTEYDAMGGSINRQAPVSTDEVKKSKSISADWPATKPASPAMLGWLKHHGIPNAFELGITAWRGKVLRDLIELHVKPETALSYSKRQALAVLDKMKAKVGE